MAVLCVLFTTTHRAQDAKERIPVGYLPSITYARLAIPHKGRQALPIGLALDPWEVLLPLILLLSTEVTPLFNTLLH